MPKWVVQGGKEGVGGRKEERHRSDRILGHDDQFRELGMETHVTVLKKTRSVRLCHFFSLVIYTPT